MNTITAGEMLSMNNDLYQICNRFIKKRLNDESYTTEELQKEFVLSVYDCYTDWDAKTDSEPFITTDIINFIIHRICTKELDSIMELSVYVRLLADELKCLLKHLKGYKSKDIISDYQLITLNDNPRTLETMNIRISLTLIN